MPERIIQPPYLRKGDEVAIVSPAFAIDGDKVEKAVSILGSWGLKVHTLPGVLKRQGPFAGTDNERLSDFQEALNNSNIRAIFCSRGGYGSLRIVNSIDFSVLTNHPKWIVGFSDITIFHMWLLRTHGIVTVHGEMPLNYSNPSKSAETLDTLREALFGEYTGIRWQGAAGRTGKGEGVVAGGNLSLLYSLAAASLLYIPPGAILFIEDVGEQYYHLDRMLTSLRLSGKLAGLSALIAGGFSDMEDTKDPWGKSAREIISDAVAGYDYPLVFDFPAGHNSDNRAFYLGRRASLTVTGTGSELIYL